MGACEVTRGPGTGEGYVGPDGVPVLDKIRKHRLVWVRLPTSRPWPMDVVEPYPTAWKLVEA